jgi:hypothetical protein
VLLHTPAERRVGAPPGRAAHHVLRPCHALAPPHAPHPSPPHGPTLANCSPSSVDTARLCARSALLPMSMMVMLGLACCRASSSQEARWSKVSRRVMSYTNSAPAAPR